MRTLKSVAFPNRIFDPHVTEIFVRHYTHIDDDFGCSGVDLWETDAPANRTQWDGVYSSYMYNTHIQSIIRDHPAENSDTPLYMYVAMQDMHAPNEVPQSFSDKYPSSKYVHLSLFVLFN